MGWMGVVTRAPFEVACWETARGLGWRKVGSMFVRVVFALRLVIELEVSWQKVTWSITRR